MVPQVRPFCSMNNQLFPHPKLSSGVFSVLTSQTTSCNLSDKVIQGVIHGTSKDSISGLCEDDSEAGAVWGWPGIMRSLSQGVADDEWPIGKLWAQRLKVGCQSTNLGLGRYPEVSLALARKRALENAQAVIEGVDPRTPVVTIPTFGEAVEAVIEARSKGWKHVKTAKRWRATLETYAMPLLERKPVSAVTSEDVMTVLEPIWLTKPENRAASERTSKRCLGMGNRARA